MHRRQPRHGTIGLLVAGLALTVLASACGQGATFRAPEQYTTPTEGLTSGGDAVAPAEGVPDNKRYLFRRDTPPVAIRQSSKDLVAAIPQTIGLRVFPLPSTDDAAALYMTENSPGTPWNTLIEQARKPVLEAFADDRTMGDWLILVTDVVVSDQPDPIAANAYRWTRAEVEEYVQCGIPDQGRNECTQVFFAATEPDEHIVLAPQNDPRQQ